jgi:hypothetical protein
MPAASGAGKSTLTAGLLQSGLSYLSDEIGALDPSVMRLVAYPKPISLDRASLAALPALRERVPPEICEWMSSEWQVPAHVIRPDASVQACRARFLIFPRLAPSEQSKLHPLRRAEAMALLVRRSFNFGDRPAQNFESCAELCRSVETFQLDVADVGSACSLVLDLFGSGRDRAVRAGERR